MPSQPARVVITGMGLISPLGNSLESVWELLSSGGTGIGELQHLDASALSHRFGGEARDFSGSIDDYGPLDKKLQRAIKKNMKVMCREIEMGVAASQLALAHSGLPGDRNPDRCGCLFGCDYILTKPEEYSDGLRNCREHADGQFSIDDWPKQGLGKVNPLWLLKYLPNMPNSHVSIYNDFRGPNNAITSRDASMNLALSEATSIIQRGAADVMIVGATGTRLHALKTPHTILGEQVATPENAQDMPCPFDQRSQGMVLSEGAAAVVLESREHAEQRGAKTWGEIIGCGSASGGSRDRVSETEFLATAATGAMRSALRQAGSAMPEKWHIHAQGLGTRRSDQAEALAINRTLNDVDSPVPVTTAKSYSGYLGAASAGVELISSLLAMANDELFPIRNLQNPLDSVQFQALRQKADPGDAVLHSSFTMEGQASCVVVAKADV